MGLIYSYSLIFEIKIVLTILKNLLAWTIKGQAQAYMVCCCSNGLLQCATTTEGAIMILLPGRVKPMGQPGMIAGDISDAGQMALYPVP